MPRFARVVEPGCPHHITHRGNRRDDLFFTPADREEYLEILFDYTRRYGVDIWGYCLIRDRQSSSPHSNKAWAAALPDNRPVGKRR